MNNSYQESQIEVRPSSSVGIEQRSSKPWVMGSSPFWGTMKGVSMKLTNIKQVHSFLKAVDQCKGDVWLESQQGDRFNLKSPLSQYVAIANLLSDHGSELELFCAIHDDEKLFFEFFERNPEVL